MDDFSDILSSAAAEIGQSYFLLPIKDGHPIQRERVYCYELYHQMRRRWTSSEYLLNGELDKSGHPKLRKKLGALKPDFLVHQPGSMERNYAAVEVKPATPSRKTIRKDLKSLSKLICEAEYRRGIYLIYGNTNEALLHRIEDVVSSDIKNVAIELWFHSATGVAAHQVAMLSS